ncbi:hypothetical protein GQ55_9G029600 [Panicum hallii var. hallii]|uniref:Rx N-terminal domain-containing protein n=1 Tax=Panicum hallii var. hallii TaxID=1504633 RepID=A0A2T7BZ11_9POAL|nr:hypothetical protein GQ55_9G029600 [Panicum hallii var. hallii]
MGGVICSAVVTDIAGRVISKVTERCSCNNKAAVNDKLWKLNMLCTRIHSSVEESQRHRITSNYLLQWQEMLKEAAADGDEILFTFNWRSLNEASKTNNNQIGTSGPLAYTKIAIYRMVEYFHNAARILFSLDEDVEKLNSTVDKLEKLSADTEEFIKLVELEVLREEENLHTKGKNTVTCNSLALNSHQDEHQPFNEAI